MCHKARVQSSKSLDEKILSLTTDLPSRQLLSHLINAMRRTNRDLILWTYLCRLTSKADFHLHRVKSHFDRLRANNQIFNDLSKDELEMFYYQNFKLISRRSQTKTYQNDLGNYASK